MNYRVVRFVLNFEHQAMFTLYMYNSLYKQHSTVKDQNIYTYSETSKLDFQGLTTAIMKCLTIFRTDLII